MMASRGDSQRPDIWGQFALVLGGAIAGGLVGAALGLMTRIDQLAWAYQLLGGGR